MPRASRTCSRRRWFGQRCSDPTLMPIFKNEPKLASLKCASFFRGEASQSRRRWVRESDVSSWSSATASIRGIPALCGNSAVPLVHGSVRISKFCIGWAATKPIGGLLQFMSWGEMAKGISVRTNRYGKPPTSWHTRWERLLPGPTTGAKRHQLID